MKAPVFSSTLLILLLICQYQGLSQTGMPENGCAPLVVNFNPPPGLNSWYWDFDDSAISFLEAPSHLFAKPGVYTISLRETQDGPLIGETTVTVYAMPSLQIEPLPAKVCPEASITLSDLTNYDPVLQPITRFWTLGNGGFSEVDNPTFSYAKPGLYTLSLKATSALSGCVSTVIFPNLVEVYTPPTPVIMTNPDPPTACEGPLVVSYSNASTGFQPLNYLWSYNGQTSTGLNIPPQTYTNAGAYEVSLQVTDGRGCTATTIDTASVGVEFFDVNVPGYLCYMDTLKIDNKVPSGTHLWDFGPEASTQYSIQRNPLIFYTNPGIYPITYSWISTTGGCQLDTVFYLEVENPMIDFTSDIPDHCSAPVELIFLPNYSGGSYRWEFDKFGSSEDESPLFTYPVDGNSLSISGRRLVSTTLFFESKGGCLDTLTKVDTLHITTAAFLAEDYNECAPFEIELIDLSYASTPIVRWHWIFGDGNEYVTTQPNDIPAHVYEECGVFKASLIVEDAAGCIDTSYLVEFKVCGCTDTIITGGGGGISILPPDVILPPFIGNGDTLCGNDSLFLQIISKPNIRYLRLEGDGDRLWHCSDARDTINVKWLFNNEPGHKIIKLTQITYLGDVYVVDTFLHFYIQGARAMGAYQTQCADPYTVQFTNKSINFTLIEWQFPDGFTTDEADPIYTFSASGDYQVILGAWDELSGCPPTFDTLDVYIRDVKADFFSPPTGCLNGPVPLDGSASVDVNGTCYKGYDWYFSSGQRPRTLGVPFDTVYFNQACEQTITLIATDINGCKDTVSRQIVIEEIQSTFTLDRDKYCLPATLVPQSTIEPICTNLESVRWTFGMDTLTTQNPEFVLEQGAASVDSFFYITLVTMTATGCSFETTDSILIYKPFSKITVKPDPPSICRFDVLTFNALDYIEGGSFLNFSWDFGTNIPMGSGSQVSPAFPDTGVFNVVLYFEEDISGCLDSLMLEVEVQDPPDIVYTTNADGLTTLCQPFVLQFFTDSDTTGLTFDWDFGNGESSTLATPATVFEKGLFEVTLIVNSSLGCADTLSWSFETQGPQGDFNFDKIGICLGETIQLTLSDTTEVGTWTWDFGDGTVLEGGNPVNHTYTNLPDSGGWVIQLLLIDPDELCPLTIEKSLTVIEIVPDFGLADSLLCAGKEIGILNFTSGATDYLWTFNNQTFNDKEPVITIPPSGGPFELKLVAWNDSLGCTDSLTRLIEIDDFSLMQLFGDTICEGDTALIGFLDTLSGFMVSWTPSNTLFSPDSSITAAIPDTTTVYYVSLDDGAGCLVMDSVEVVVYQDFSSFSDWDTLVLTGTTLTLPGPQRPGLIYQWIPPDGLSCSNCPNPTFTANQDRIYRLVLTDSLGCFEGELMFTITVATDSIDIPNVFTPNGDNVNDFFHPVIPGLGVAILDMKIYSRWGNLIYDQDNPGVGWDGTHKGVECPMDVYAYVIKAGFLDGREHYFRGDITLVR